MTVIPQELQQHWTAISPLLSVRNEDEYDLAVERLNRLLDEVGTDEQHPLYSLLDILQRLSLSLNRLRPLQSARRNEKQVNHPAWCGKVTLITTGVGCIWHYMRSKPL